MEKRDHTLLDHKCTTCGSWMQTSERSSPKGIRIINYFCTECGLSYSIEG